MNELKFIELFKLGLSPIPLIWNPETKSADSHCIAHSEVTHENYTEDTFSSFVKSFDQVNGIALKLFPPFGCIDFDLKNTEDKTIFDVWMRAVSSIDDGILSKIAIESTRNSGYHVYIKYKGLIGKQNLAREVKGEEVIAIYTGGTLSYCDPTPGYNMFHNEFRDIEELTQDEFEILTSCATTFDKYIPVEGVHKSDIIKDYPVEYENICFQFDKGVNDEVFETIINGLDLYRCKDYRYNKKDKHVAFLRKGSKAKYSAKVYFNTKNLQIFSSSIAGFPCFNDRISKDDTSWNLSPTRIIYYKNDRDWIATIEEINLIADSADIELIPIPDITAQSVTPVDKLKFPYDIFSEDVISFINYHRVQHEYMAGAILAAASTLIGNSATLRANDGYYVKPILYMAIVAPPGATKSPALKSVFKTLENLDTYHYDNYISEKKIYKELLGQYKNQQKGGNLKEPEKPILKQNLIKDSTIEMLIKILSFNAQGCCLLADELSGFLNRMNRYGDNDEIQKWLEMWSGSPVLMQRIGRDEDKVENPFCTIIGGIQPGVLDSLSSKANEFNGFYHRFLFLYPDPMKKQEWAQFTIPEQVKINFNNVFQNILYFRDRNRVFTLSKEANDLYAQWFNNKNQKYNIASSDNIKGIIAKYQEYCLRFSLIIQILNDGSDYNQIVNNLSMERAIRLTEYFFGNMHKAMKILAPESPIDKITGIKLELYNSLPASFSTKSAIITADALKIKESNCRIILRRWSEGKDQIITKSGDQRNSVYEKIF